MVRPLFLIFLSSLIFLSGFSPEISDVVYSKTSGDDGEWVYYGFAPTANYSSYYTPVGHVFIKSSGRNRVTVIGYNDSTRVTVYDLTEDERVIESFIINRMQAHSVGFPNQKEANISRPLFFKVVSDKPVAVLLSSGSYNVSTISIGGQNIYYPSTDGGFAGKEFIFLSVPATSITARKGFDYAVFAVEDSTVEIRDKNDKVIRTFNIAANSSKRIELFSNKIYRVTSTGRIMISSWTSGPWGSGSFTICPSPMGGYRGRIFFANPEQKLLGSAFLLILSQENPVKVKVFDMDTGSLIVEKSLQPREMWFINKEEADVAGKRVMVLSDKEVIVYAGSTLVPEGALDTPGQIAQGVALVTIKANEPTTIFSPADAYVFSPKGDAEITINGLRMKIPKNTCKNIPMGKVTITSNVTVIVEIISNINYFIEASTLYGRAGLRIFATYLQPVNSLELTYPAPKVSEAGGAGGIDIILMVSVLVAILAISVGIIMMKRRTKI